MYYNWLKTNVLVVIFATLSTGVNGQQDSSYLDFEQLNSTDIDLAEEISQETRVFAGTRTEQNLEDLPFTVFVITAKEIRDHGYHTLTDALRHLPGIRVSQPGSGLDGETFMMRGLYGNTYAKILINNVPVRPSVVGAMPIGSQLPIKQAERIEVIYGPAATLYGSDAAAGVINIILKDSEYPTYAQADIEIGSEDLTRLSAMFGGKVPIGNKALKIKMFGGYTSFKDLDVKYDLDNLYNPQVYEDLNDLINKDVLQYEDRPNYVGTTDSTILAELPHTSSYIGLSAEILGIDFHVQRLFRADHSSIGLNPYAVSYADPQSQFGEQMVTTTLGYKKSYNSWNFNIRFSSLAYNVNSLSSYRNVIPLYGALTNLYAQGEFGPTNLDPIIDIPKIVDSLYLSGPRYVSSNYNDFSFEAQANFKIAKGANMSAGLRAESGSGDALESYKPVPGNVDNGIVIPDFFISPNSAFSSINSFIEGNIKLGSFSAIAGIQGFFRSDFLDFNDPVINPRLGILYRFTPQISIRSSYSQAFRYPAAFYSNSSYTVSSKEGLLNVERGSPDLEPEETINFEIGMRHNASNYFKWDMSMYISRTSNFINYNIQKFDNPTSVFWGYENDPDSYLQLMGVQLNLQIKNLIPSIKFTTDVNLNLSKGKENILQFSLDPDQERVLQELPVVRAQPDFIGHISTSFQPIKSITIFLNQSFMTKSWTRNKLRVTNALKNNTIDEIKNKGYYTLGGRVQFRISRQLNSYVDFANITNVQYAGIDATPGIDGLLYNPQPLLRYRFGVNYTFN